MFLPLTTQATVTASGGSLTNDFGDFRYHVFTNTGPADFNVTVGGDVEVLIVGGGGGGGGSGGSGASGAGGGAGGLILTNVSISPDDYTITVGAGGDSTSSGDVPGDNGVDSVAFGLTAIGGGGGGARGSGNADGRDGGSGGGVGSQQNGGWGSGEQPGSASGGYGHDGGDSGFSGSTGAQNASGGGGGAGGPGGDGLDNDDSGDGGIGIDLSDWLLSSDLGDEGWFAGGGGGGRAGSTADSFGEGGQGGGADGGDNDAINAMPNTGGGGGGAGRNGAPSDGGSGIVIVRYAYPLLRVESHDATSIGPTNATLNGRITGFGGAEAPEMFFCWGTTDGGTSSTGNWHRVVSIGDSWSMGDYLSLEIFEFDVDTTYFYRAYATNSAGDVWSELVEFSTLKLPDVSNDGLLWTSRRQASVAGTLTDDGREPARVWAEYWPTDAGTPTSTVEVATLTTGETFDATLEDLDPETDYTFRFAASNAVGIVHSGEDILTTHSADSFAWYVATNGNHSAGTNWATAWNDVHHALDIVESGDTVYFKEGVYALANQLEITDTDGLMLSGGWAGNDTGGLPGTQGMQETVLTRDPATTTMRIIYAASSTLTFTNLTITDGYLTSAHGAGIYLDNSQTILTHSRVVTNRLGNSTRHGIGIYATGGSLTLIDSEISGNSDQGNLHIVHGGGLYATSTDLAATNVVFADNSISHNNGGLGGGVYLIGGSARFVGCVFLNNTISGAGGNTEGIAIYSRNVADLVISNCLFSANMGQKSAGSAVAGNVIYIDGSGNQVLADSLLVGNGGDAGSRAMTFTRGGTDSRDVHLNTSGATVMHGMRMVAGSGHGIYKTGAGSLTISNMLVAAHPGNGVIIDNGSVTIAQATIADNALFGILNQSGSPITLIDSIVWGNRDGGIDGDATVDYSNVQETHPGTGNLSADPLFSGGNYYLSVDGLTGQTLNSPCLGVGSDTAEKLGLDGLTTRTDGQAASGQVDLGYHHAAGMSAGEIARLNLFVNAGTGHDVNNDGLSAGNAFKTITRALQEVVQGSTIHIAPGIYDTTLGEIFPLVIPVANLSLVGNDSETTRIDAEATAQALNASAAGLLRLEGLTLERGKAKYGGGLNLSATQTVITNCVIRDHAIDHDSTDNRKRGVGIYCWHGRLDLLDSQVLDNRETSNYAVSGGGVYAERTVVVIKNSVLRGNGVRGNNSASGGAMYLRLGRLYVDASTFSSNIADRSGNATGGAIHAHHLESLTIDNSLFEGNQALRGGQGVVFYFDGSDQVVTITGCVLSNNYHDVFTHDIYNINSSVAINRTMIFGGSGSGYYQHNASASIGITNSLIHSQPGDGIRINAGSASIASTTLADNGGWGLVVDGTDLAVENTIAWGNADGGISNNASGTATIIHTASQEAHGDPSDNNLAGQDPEFEDAAAANYRIQRSSPALDAGINRPWMANATDLAGVQRILPGAGGNYTVDLGAYETIPPSGSMFMFR